jgi:hypothetical protein
MFQAVQIQKDKSAISISGLAQRSAERGPRRRAVFRDGNYMNFLGKATELGPENSGAEDRRLLLEVPMLIVYPCFYLAHGPGHSLDAFGGIR